MKGGVSSPRLKSFDLATAGRMKVTLVNQTTLDTFFNRWHPRLRDQAQRGVFYDELIRLVRAHEDVVIARYGGVK